LESCTVSLSRILLPLIRLNTAIGNTQNALSDYRQAVTLYQQQGEGDTSWSDILKRQIEYLEDEL